MIKFWRHFARRFCNWNNCLMLKYLFKDYQFLVFQKLRHSDQWHNRRREGGEGARVPPRDFWPGNFRWPIEKREARTKGKMEKKRRKFEKGKVEKRKWNEEKLQNEERLIFFFFFSQRPNFFGSTKMEIFYWEKAFHAGKKIRKINLPPRPRKIFLLRPWLCPTRVTRLKVAPNMADPISLKNLPLT